MPWHAQMHCAVQATVAASTNLRSGSGSTSLKACLGAGGILASLVHACVCAAGATKRS
jgi:hypothetical protein